MGSHSEDIIKRVLDFDVNDSDCIITGYPKSGTTWLQEVVCLVLHGDLDLCNKIPNYARVPYLETAAAVDFLKLQPHPRVFKSHLPFQLLPRQVQEKDCKLICIMRNPKDVAVSMYEFYKRFNTKELGDRIQSWSEFLDTFTDGLGVIGGWFDHVLGWWRQRKRPNILIIHYEDMKTKPKETILEIATFLNRRLYPGTIQTVLEHSSFESMKNNVLVNMSGLEESNEQSAGFLRKGIVGDWKNYFTSEQNRKFDKLYGERLGNFALEFKFE